MLEEIGKPAPARIGLGMGDETWKLFCNSKAYYEKSGIQWSNEEEMSLEDLKKRICVFDRSEKSKDAIELPSGTGLLSSTRVRERTLQFGRKGHDMDSWVRELSDLVPEQVAVKIRENGLYQTR